MVVRGLATLNYQDAYFSDKRGFMSEQGSHGENPTSTPLEQMVPKERLDELIQERRALQEQNNILSQVLRQAVPHRQVVQEQEPDYLKQLAQENPAAYQAHKRQELALKQQSAAMFTVMDNVDRTQFVQEFGDVGKSYLPKVEAELERLRAAGYGNYNRGQIFFHLKGQESLKAPAKTPQTPVTTTPEVTSSNNNVPSTNPASAGTTAGGSAAAAPTKKTIEDLERELGDVII